MKPSLENMPSGRMLYRLPLSVRMVLAGLVLGSLVWLALDWAQSRSLQRIYERDFTDRLSEQAQRDRLRFDQAVRTHAHFLHLVAGQAETREHLKEDHATEPAWGTPEAARHQPEIIDRMPAWMPPRAVMRSFSTPDYIAVLDPRDRVHELYTAVDHPPPTPVLRPGKRLLRISEHQTYLAEMEEAPYLVATAPVRDSDGKVMARVMSVSRINSRFLLNSQGLYLGSEAVVALLAGDPLKVIASSAPERLSVGTPFDGVSDDFLVTGKAFFDYGASELQTTFATLLPRNRFQELVQPVLDLERNQRTILAALLIGLFLAFLLYLSHRIRRLISRVADTTSTVFGVAPESLRQGDELKELERQFGRLVDEVMNSRQALEQEAQQKLDMVSRQLEMQAENERLGMLQAVTDALGVGVIRITEAGPEALTPQMEAFAADCGSVAAFVEAAAGDGSDLEMEDREGRRRTFSIMRPPDLTDDIMLVQDVTAQRRTERELWNLALYPSQNPMPVMRVDGEGILLHANPASSSVLRTWGCRVGGPLPEAWRPVFLDVFESCKRLEKEIEIGDRVYSLMLVPIPQAGYINVYGTDVTDRRHAEEALQKANDDLENRVAERTRDLEAEIKVRERAEEALKSAKEQAELANRAKTEFLANMSHELRTPLNAIIGFSEMMAAEVFGALGHQQYRDYALDIHQSGRHLLEIINDILDVSKIEVGQMDLVPETVTPASLADAAFRLVRERAQKGEVTLVDDVPEDLPAVRVDARRAKQVFLNLVSNAIKFTSADGAVRMAARQEGDQVVFTVTDSGIGMTEEEISVALAPFGQVDSQLARKYEGTGLGLPLAKSLTELHGGALWIDSRKGEGTTVSVALPVAAQGDADTGTVAADEDGGA